MEKKIKISPETLCKNLPEQFVTYFQYVKNLKFEEKPDYKMLKLLFRDVLYQTDELNDFMYDWVTLSSTIQTKRDLDEDYYNNQNKSTHRNNKFNYAL